MEVKAGYKRTEIGLIPNDWMTRKLSALGLDISDGNYSSKYPKASDFKLSGIPFIRANNIKNLKISNFDMRFISPIQHADLLKGHLKENDILVTTRGEIGLVAFVTPDYVGSNINAQIVRINSTRTKLVPKYLGYVLSSFIVEKQYENLQTGSALKQLPVGRLVRIEIPIPPSECEQQAIANALSDADALIESLEQLIEKKRQIKQGVMQELLTGKRRLPGFSGEWVSCELGELIENCSSGSTPYRGRADFYKGDVRWITSGELNYCTITDTKEHISKEAVIKTNLKMHPPGTFLMAITGLEAAGTRGACGIVGKSSTTNQSCMAVYPNSRLHSRYLYHYYVFKGNELALSYCQGTKQQSYTARLVKILPISIPPTIKEQETIASILSDSDGEIVHIKSRLGKVKQVKQAMMQDLLTGKVRLV